MFKRGDRVKIIKMIITEKDGGSGVGILSALQCMGKEGTVHTVHPRNALPYYVKMSDPELASSYWREEELEHV